MNNDFDIDWFAPIVADAEAGFGGNLNAFELMKNMIKVYGLKSYMTIIKIFMKIVLKKKKYY